jgi:hypothetical protein
MRTQDLRSAQPLEATPGASDVGDDLAGFGRRADGGTVVARERMRHRPTMAGDPIAVRRNFSA